MIRRLSRIAFYTLIVCFGELYNFIYYGLQQEHSRTKYEQWKRGRHWVHFRAMPRHHPIWHTVFTHDHQLQWLLLAASINGYQLSGEAFKITSTIHQKNKEHDYKTSPHRL